MRGPHSVILCFFFIQIYLAPLLVSQKIQSEVDFKIVIFGESKFDIMGFLNFFWEQY